MSRSIHSTHNEYGLERRFRYSDEQAQHERLAAIRERIEKKRQIKWRVLNERGKLPLASLPPLPPAAPEAVPINILEQGEWIHYPASSIDLQGVMKRLPVGVLTGLSGIRLCLGKDYQENNLTAEELAKAERDPWVGRAGFENLPGVFGGEYLGTYWIHPARIDLYAYVYDPALPQRGMWELFLRLRMLSAFVHEVAHHEDHMRRVARGRWRADDTGKNEAFAEAFIHRFLQHVLPKGFVKVRYLGFFAPGCRKRLAALRQQLEQKCPENLGEAEATPKPADSTPEPKLCCPSCGQPLLFQRTIQPTGRCPP